ncbi:hypothetical protein JCM6882_009180 [Rhodosporidiobolus microsporus]
MVPAEELPVLEALVHIRNRLTALKKDRTEYIRARDVLDVYNSLMDEVTRLNEVRAAPQASTSGKEKEKEEEKESAADGQDGEGEEGAEGTEKEKAVEVEENRVDTILNDVFQLLSLFFLRIGKSRESPATFCQLGTMKRLLTHLNESGIYTSSDLKPYQARLAELKEIITSGEDSADADGGNASGATGDEAQKERERDEAMTRLLLAKWDVCDRLVTHLSLSLTRLSPALYPLHQRLITLRRSLASIAARPRPSASDVAPILTELRQLEEKRASSPSGTKFAVPSSSGATDPETGEPVLEEPPLGQELLAGLLEDNFNICEEIKAREGEDEVSRGPLQAIYDRLSEIRAQLERLVLTHRWTLRETDLYNYQNELARVDALRVDGKFRDAEGNVPEGQLQELPEEFEEAN